MTKSSTLRAAGSGPIFLIGMMGVGKSTIGPQLAKRLGVGFMDSDHEIERRAGCTVAEIFDRDGEARFRELEEETIARISQANVVISLGGGAILAEGAIDKLKALGTLVYLAAPANVLLERIRNPASRPLLAGLDRAGMRARLEALLAAREALYLGANHIVDASGGVEEVVQVILSQLGRTPVKA